MNATALAQWEKFLQVGMPQRSNERWKYADLSVLKNFVVTPTEKKEIPHHELQEFITNYKKRQLERKLVIPAPQRVRGKLQLGIQPTEHIFLIFVNGSFVEEYSDHQRLPKEIVVSSMRAKLEIADTSAEQTFAVPEHYPFAHLNAALFTDGLYLFVPDDCVFDQPIQLLSIITQPQSMTQLRHHIVLGARSKLTLLEDYAGIHDKAYWMNSVTTVELKTESRLQYCKLQQESKNAIHIAHTFVKLKQSSEFEYTNFSSGGQFVRDEVLIRIEEANVKCQAAGFYRTRHAQHYIDQHIDIEHLAPQSQSEMFYKGIIGEKATAVFNGRLYVDKAAQKTTAQQSNQHLLLSKNANAYAKPELEINADDVKCKHGSATGQMNADTLFYLRSRGLSVDEAQQLLEAGFAEEIIQRAPFTIKHKIKTIMGLHESEHNEN